MFISNRSFLTLIRAILFGLIFLAIVLWFLCTILIRYPEKDFVYLKSNENDFIDEFSTTDKKISELSQESVMNYDKFKIDREIEPDFSYENINNDTMVFASAILRHGDCAVFAPGQPLTISGSKQVYEAGQFLRRRYNKLLGDDGYSSDNIYVLSANTNRAIMSAQTCLAGMFPPTDEDRFDDNIFWHPIPLHTLPDEMDIFFRGGKPCPKYTELYYYYMEESPEAKRLLRKYRHLIKHWEYYSDWDLRTIEDVADLHRSLIHKQENDKLYSWDEEAIDPDGPMSLIRNVVTKLRGTPELVRHRAGFLIKEILYFADLKINRILDADRSLYLYSCHSSTILPILNGFGIYELNLPPYASSLHFEVYKNDQDEHYFQVFYRKPNDEHPLPLDVPGCGEKWTLDQFVAEHDDIIPRDFKSECGLID